MSEGTFQTVRTEYVIRTKYIIFFFILPGKQATLSHLTILYGHIEYITPHSTYIIMYIASMVIIILYGPLCCVNNMRVAIQIYVKLSCVHTRRNMLSRSSRAIHIAMYVFFMYVYVDHNTCVQYSSRHNICISAFSQNRQI